MHIRATYDTHCMHTYMHVCIRAVNVCARKCMYMHVSDFIEAVYRLDWSSMCPYSQHIRADTDTLLGTPYARICTYMHVFLSAFWRKYVHIHTVTVLSRLLWVHRRRRRSLHFRRAVATASLSRGSASAGRSPNLIRSGLRDQSARSRRRQLGQARLGCAMAILVTTEQRSPGDGEMIRYIC